LFKTEDSLNKVSHELKYWGNFQSKIDLALGNTKQACDQIQSQSISNTKLTKNMWNIENDMLADNMSSDAAGFSSLTKNESNNTLNDNMSNDFVNSIFSVDENFKNHVKIDSVLINNYDTRNLPNNLGSTKSFNLIKQNSNKSNANGFEHFRKPKGEEYYKKQYVTFINEAEYITSEFINNCKINDKSHD